MKTPLALCVVGCIWVTATNAVLGQRADLNSPKGGNKVQRSDSNPTTLVVARLLDTWYKTDEKEPAVKKQIERTIEVMGPPVAQPLATLMEHYWFRVFSAKKDAKDAKALATVKIAAKMLGKQGNVVAQDPDVMDTLLAFTHPTKKVDGQEKPVPVDEDVRVAAMDALGNIFAQKATFLVLWSPSDLTKENNKEALTAVEYLRNETQGVKKDITSLLLKIRAANVNQEKKEAEEEIQAARACLLETRNLCRKFKNYRKLLVIMSELEPPIGKEKDLSTRIAEALSDMEGNLRDAYAPPVSSKEQAGTRRDEPADKVGKEPADKVGKEPVDKVGKEPSNKGEVAARLHAAALAEQKANDLSEEMDDLVHRVDNWLQINERTRKVILTFQEHAREGNTPVIQACAVEALGRIYGSRN